MVGVVAGALVTNYAKEKFNEIKGNLSGKKVVDWSIYPIVASGILGIGGIITSVAMASAIGVVVSIAVLAIGIIIAIGRILRLRTLRDLEENVIELGNIVGDLNTEIGDVNPGAVSLASNINELKSVRTGLETCLNSSRDLCEDFKSGIQVSIGKMDTIIKNVENQVSKLECIEEESSKNAKVIQKHAHEIQEGVDQFKKVNTELNKIDQNLSQDNEKLSIKLDSLKDCNENFHQNNQNLRETKENFEDLSKKIESEIDEYKNISNEIGKHTGTLDEVSRNYLEAVREISSTIADMRSYIKEVKNII